MQISWYLLLAFKLSLTCCKLLQYDDEVVSYVKNLGFECTAHEVVTQDGYILRVHHLPPKNKQISGNKKPVFLMHSAFSNSLYYLNTPNISLGFYLSEKGYDVWLGNVRGSKYATAHKWLDTESLAYWRFSFHEMGVFDLPVMIDYTLQQTRQDKCFYIGHSQACTQLLAFLSLRPEYNQKIIQSHLMSPIGAMANPRFPVKSLAPLYIVR
jgi:pimeloyl-ACP methyl ester carboxylesterase